MQLVIAENPSLAKGKLTENSVRDLLQKALKEKADGHPTVLANLLEYNYSNLRGVIRGKRLLPGEITRNLCELLAIDIDPFILRASQPIGLRRGEGKKHQLRKALRLAVKDKAGGRPEKLAQILDYDHTKLLCVLSGYGKLPIKKTDKLCKLLGRTDAKELHSCQPD